MAPRTLYLGDGAYAEIGDGRITLTTHNGLRVTNRIVLGVDEWEALVRFVWAHDQPPHPPEADE